MEERGLVGEAVAPGDSSDAGFWYGADFDLGQGNIQFRKTERNPFMRSRTGMQPPHFSQDVAPATFTKSDMCATRESTREIRTNSAIHAPADSSSGRTEVSDRPVSGKGIES